MTLEAIAPVSDNTQPSSCPPWHPERSGPTLRTPLRAPGSYTNDWYTILAVGESHSEFCGTPKSTEWPSYLTTIHGTCG